MPTITVTIQAGGNSYGKSKTINGTDLARMVAAWRKELPPNDDGSQRTDQQVLDAWSDYVFQGLRAVIRHQEYQDSVKQAEQNLSDVGLT